MGPIIIARVGQPGVSPVPVLHGVLQPVQIRPTPDMELPSVLEYCRQKSLGVVCDLWTGGTEEWRLKKEEGHLHRGCGQMSWESSISDVRVGEVGIKTLHGVGGVPGVATYYAVPA